MSQGFQEMGSHGVSGTLPHPRFISAIASFASRGPSLIERAFCTRWITKGWNSYVILWSTTSLPPHQVIIALIICPAYYILAVIRTALTYRILEVIHAALINRSLAKIRGCACIRMCFPIALHYIWNSDKPETGGCACNRRCAYDRKNAVYKIWEK